MRGIPDPKGFHGDGNEVAIAWRQEARRLDAALTAAQERTRRIVEAGDRLADAWDEFVHRGSPPLNEYAQAVAEARAAYREAVGGES